MSKRVGIIKGLDDGIFRQAKQDVGAARAAGNNIAPGVMHWLTRKVLEQFDEDGTDHRGKDIDPEADLEKHVDDCLGRWGVEKSSPTLAVYKGAAIEIYGVTRELQARGIRPSVDTGAKFFGPGAGENSPLFPPLLASTFIVSRLSAGLADLLVYADIPTDELSVNKVRLNESASDRQLRNVGIGDPLPRTELSHVDTNVPMRKYGRLFEYAREVVQVQPLAVVQAFIGQITKQIAIDETDEVIDKIVAGDGEVGSALTDTTPATDGVLTYADLVKLEMAFPNSYAGRIYLADSTSFGNILAMSEYKDPLANRGVQLDRGIPWLPTPSGMGRIYRWSSTGSAYMAEAGGRIVAVDPTIAAYLRRSPLLEEQDTLIASGRQQVALSYRMAALKGDPNASQSLDITA